MSAPSVERPRVIRRKIIVPDTPVGVVPRERLDGLLCQLVDAHRVVAVAATAGAGKSVAVAHASRRFKRPVAWLSVDATEFTQDVAHGVEVAKRIDTGMVSINHPTRLKADLPFGGVKISGYGNELADLGIQEFVNKKLINVVPIDAPA